MRAPDFPLLVLAIAATCGCRAPFPQPLGHPRGDAGLDAATRVAIDPDADPGAAPPVLRLEVELPEGVQEDAGALGLYEGELDDYHLRRIEKQDLPKTLLERRVPSMAWADGDGGPLVLAPTVPLSAGGTYSLASPGLGLVGVVRVREAGALPLFGRVWPPLEAGSGARHAIYCADGGAPAATRAVELSPGHIPARMAPGVGASGVGAGVCVHLSADALPAGGTFMPPPRVGSIALDPAPLENRNPPPPPPPDCPAGEAQFGPGCVLVEDDRVVVRSPDAALFWAVAAPGSVTIDAADAGARFVVRGLAPSTMQALDVTTIDVAGREQRSTVEVSTSGARPHVVVNEVLANPLGPEPTEEWVELVNAGTTPVDLDGWTLSDIGGSTVLPSYVMAPGEFALIVRDDFVSDDGLDVAPPPDTALLRVPAIGSHGLSNSGEPLTLADPAGQVRSRFPAVPKPKAGLSVARRHPWSLDDDPHSFGLSGGKGASPGAQNQLAE